MSLVEFKKVIYQNLHNFTQEEVFEAATNGASLDWTRAEAAEYLSQMLNHLSRAKKDDNLVHNYQLKLVSLLAWYQVNPNNYTQLADKLISRILEMLGIQSIQEETKEETKENRLTELKNRISKFEQQIDIDRAVKMAMSIRKTTAEIETILQGYLMRF